MPLGTAVVLFHALACNIFRFLKRPLFEQTDDGLMIKTPPFETFGGDVQRISSYVFGDKALSKPYDEWVQEQLRDRGSAEELIQALGKDINEELII